MNWYCRKIIMVGGTGIYKCSLERHDITVMWSLHSWVSLYSLQNDCFTVRKSMSRVCQMSLSHSCCQEFGRSNPSIFVFCYSKCIRGAFGACSGLLTAVDSDREQATAFES